MYIESVRRHAFYFDTENQLHSICPYRFDRLWRGEPDAAMPDLAGQRVRFAVLHVERFTSPPRVVVEHYPVLLFDAHGHLDLEHHRAQLTADVDRIEVDGYALASARTETVDLDSEWRPQRETRQRLLAATDIYAPRESATPLPFEAAEPRSRTFYGRWASTGPAWWSASRAMSPIRGGRARYPEFDRRRLAP